MKTILAAITIAALTLSTPTLAEAGCRCGRSNISTDKTCHQKVCDCPNCDATQASKPPKATKRKAPQKVPEWRFERLQEKTIDREDGEEHTYPWVIFSRRYKRKAETLSMLVDCADGTVCTVRGGCYFDTDWTVVVSGTVGGSIVNSACGQEP